MTGKNGNVSKEIIVLVDSSTPISELDGLANKNNIQIITFDYCSHVSLQEKNIQHMISESYGDNTIVEKLQHVCYSFLKWYELELIKNNLQFHDVIIPKLFTDQLWPSIVKIVKKFSEVRKIYERYPNSKYYATGDLLEIIKIFTSSCLKFVFDIPEKLYFDEIELGIRLGRKELTFSMSKTSYYRIKRVGETLLQLFVGHTVRQEKTELLIEFNTKNFESFLLEGKTQNKNILFYCRRRPAIWDFKSFMIIKRSNCALIVPHKLHHKNFFSEIDISYKQLVKQLSFVLQNDEQLYNFFRIDEISIWSVIKPKIKSLLENSMKDVIYEILLVRKMFETYRINSVLVISEAGLTEQIVIKQAKHFGVKVFHLQEGLYFDTTEAYENERLQGVYPELEIGRAHV